MARCRVDPSLERHSVGGLAFPLGVYPVEEMAPKPGYTVEFEPADGDNEGHDWEEWPDRYMFDIVITSERVEPLCRAILSLMPGRIFPILDVLGQDAYREVDPYISYDLVGLDRFQDALRRFRGFFFEDGLVGFGCMSEEPFVYMFVDEHKIITVRVEPDMKDRLERLLKAFDLESMNDPAGADAVSHEHRSVLVTEEGRSDLLGFDEIVEVLRDDWRLVLNIDPETNVDDASRELGVTGWRCLARCEQDDADRPRYLEVVLSAGCLRQAEELVLEAADELPPSDDKVWDDVIVVQSDRVDESQMEEIGKALSITMPKPPLEPGIIWKGWLE